MGEVIRKNAAVDDIIADVLETHGRAVAKQGIWKSLAEEILGSSVTIVTKVNANLAAAEAALAPLEMEVDAIDSKADKFLGEKSDEIWNKLERPGNDPAYAVLFPGGIGAYTDGPDEEQPDRMDLFAELLEAGIHPRLDADFAKGIADATRDISGQYRTKINAVLPPRAKRKLLQKVKAAVARSAQMQLASYKRRLLAAGMTEAQIHEVIPDRPSTKPAPKAEAAAKAGPAAGNPGTPD